MHDWWALFGSVGHRLCRPSIDLAGKLVRNVPSIQSKILLIFIGLIFYVCVLKLKAGVWPGL